MTNDGRVKTFPTANRSVQLSDDPQNPLVEDKDSAFKVCGRVKPRTHTLAGI